MKVTQKGSFIEAHFTVGKSASLFARTRQASDDTFGNLKPFPKTFKCFPFKEQDSEKACKGVEEEDKGSFDIAMSTFLPKCKVVIYNYVFSLLLFHAKFDCNYIQSFVPCIYCGI